MTSSNSGKVQQTATSGVYTAEMGVSEALAELQRTGDVAGYEAWDSKRVAAAVSAASVRRPARLDVKRNKSGGLFIRHPKVVGYSTGKQKDYIAGINLAVGVGESLFADDDVLLEIAIAVRELVASEKGVKVAA